MQNSFGKTSRLLLKTIGTEGGTLLEELSFTAPYKIMTPFEKSNGGISVMPLCASAGIMEGDCQELDFQVGEGSNLEVLSQSFDKIHRMREGQATRMIRAEVKKPCFIITSAGNPFGILLLKAGWIFIWKMRQPACFWQILFPAAGWLPGSGFNTGSLLPG